jgi:hypothetical protein
MLPLLEKQVRPADGTQVPAAPALLGGRSHTDVRAPPIQALANPAMLAYTAEHRASSSAPRRSAGSHVPTRKQETLMIHEMRIYHCAPGRLPALNARFSNITLGFFEKYGIRQVGFWTTLVGASNQTLTYLLAWESLAERETTWNAFARDPEWIAARAATEAESIIVERIENFFLSPTAYSALK